MILNEVYILLEEIKGDILYETLPFNVKYILYKNIEILENEKKIWDLLVNDLITKYSTSKVDGKSVIEPNTHNYTQFQSELTLISSNDVDIELIMIDSSLLNEVTLKNYYPMTFKYLIK